MSNITPSTPYLAPGAPKSPILLAVAGLLVALGSALASKLGFTLPVDGFTATAVASALAGLVGYVQHRLAHREQVTGAARLDATLVQALGQAPPAPEAILGALERLRPRPASFIPTTTGMPRVTPWPAPPARRTIPPWEDAVGESLRPPTAAEQLLALDSIARALGAELWLAAEKNASVERKPYCCEPGCPAPPVWWQGSDDRDRFSLWCGEHLPPLEPGEARHRLEPDVPAPRPRVHSNALLDDAGDPVSAGDLDSEDGLDEDERRNLAQAERIEAEITRRRGWDPDFAASMWRSKHAGIKAEIASAANDGLGGSWLTFGFARRRKAEDALEEIVGAREARLIIARTWTEVTGEPWPNSEDADPDERTTERVEEIEP